MICMKIDLQPSLEVLSDLNFEDLEIHLYELVKCKMRFRFLEHMGDKVFDLWNPMIWRLKKWTVLSFLALHVLSILWFGAAKDTDLVNLDRPP